MTALHLFNEASHPRRTRWRPAAFPSLFKAYEAHEAYKVHEAFKNLVKPAGLFFLPMKNATTKGRGVSLSIIYRSIQHPLQG